MIWPRMGFGGIALISTIVRDRSAKPSGYLFYCGEIWCGLQVVFVSALYSGEFVQRLSKKLLKNPTAVKIPNPSKVQNRMQAKR